MLSFRSALPPVRRVILVESGSRPILERAIPRLRNIFGASVPFDLITCYAGAPRTLESGGLIWRTQEHSASGSRDRLAAEMREAGGNVLAIICSGEPIMARWKWWLAWKLPVKVLIINENADCFWLDRANLRPLRQMAQVRAGLTSTDGLALAIRALAFPFLLVYLLLYATLVHTRRAVRLAFFNRVT